MIYFMLKTEWMTRSFNDSVIHSVLGIKLIINNSKLILLHQFCLIIAMNIIKHAVNLITGWFCLQIWWRLPIAHARGEIQHWVAWPGGASRVNRRCDRESVRDRLKSCVTRRKLCELRGLSTVDPFDPIQVCWICDSTIPFQSTVPV